MVQWLGEKALPYFKPVMCFFEDHGFSAAWVGVILWIFEIYFFELRNISKDKKLTPHEKRMVILAILLVLLGIMAQIGFWKRGGFKFLRQ